MRSRRKVPAGYKLVEKPMDIYDIEGIPLTDVQEILLGIAGDMLEPMIEEVSSGGWGSQDLSITGFRAMTDKELALSIKRSEASKRTARERKQKVEAAERREFERLAKKYG